MKISDRLDLSPRTVAYRDIVSLHRASEALARRVGRNLASALVSMGRQELAKDASFLLIMAQKNCLKQEHWDLFCQIVRDTVDKPHSRRIKGATLL